MLSLAAPVLIPSNLSLAEAVLNSLSESDRLEAPQEQAEKMRHKSAWKGGGNISGFFKKQPAESEPSGAGRPAETSGSAKKAAEMSPRPVNAAECRFIVNVSSMEGKFYRRKLATHPHTNMAKAALNMMTRTSAADYQKNNIYMTAVDTG